MTLNYNFASSSYWISHYIAADNGHDYFAIVCQAGVGPDLNTFVSLLDITTKVYHGATYITPGKTISNTTFDVDAAGLHMYAASPDLFSVLVAISSLPGLTFNLTSQPQGPNLYHGGAGAFSWGIDIPNMSGTGLTNEWGAPDMWVTGTITENQKQVNVIPGESRSWFDRQWGNGAATAGWTWYNIFLENGIILAIWHSNPIPGFSSKTDSFATILFVDGHQEIYPINNDIHPTDPFVSPQTNLTYYGSYQVVIPDVNAKFNITLAVHTGEMTVAEAPTAANTLFEAYVDVEGLYEGVPVSGYGLSEVKYGLA
jgi:hypothetical protein